MKRSITFLSIYFLLSLTENLFAQPYPNRPIQIIITHEAGSIADINARALFKELERTIGTKIIPINKPGASATLGLDIVARSKKDGYTLAYTGSAGLVYAPIINPQVPYDPNKDLEPLGSHTMVPFGIAIKADSPWKTFKELIDDAYKNPEKLRITTFGVGSAPHFIVEIIQSVTRVKFNHIPLKGGEYVITALLGGHIEMVCDMVNKFTPHVESGKLRVVLVTQKIDYFPNVPTLRELGYKHDVPLPSLWFAMYGPAGLPEDVKKVLIPAIEKVVKCSELKEKMEKIGFTVYYNSPEEFKKIVLEEYNTALNIAQRIGLKK